VSDHEFGTSARREAGGISRLAWLAVCVVVAGLGAACGPSETEIRQDVRARLAASPATANLGLSIEVRNRAVYLSGGTSTRDEQQQAMDLARAAAGVRLVVNDMWLDNTGLADRVKAALAADPMVGKIPIEVDAKGDLVRLMSDQTSSEERERAVQIAAGVEGVGQVEDRMK